MTEQQLSKGREISHAIDAIDREIKGLINAKPDSPFTIQWELIPTVVFNSIKAEYLGALKDRKEKAQKEFNNL